ncbi:lysophospholipid acyltransferase family protein [Parasphingorhabdus sp.]|uniref:lysophospholipid acyltransferase family protein n=1 Tax=Parasphingorhabdus sp. TaxID=2709688 RepID=UPI0030016DF6
MGTVRSIIFYIAWALWTALFGLAIPFLWLSGSPPKIIRMLSRFWARGILIMLSGIVGLKYVLWNGKSGPSGPSLIISNHQSMWETLAALVLFPDVAIVAKRELLRIPVMGWYLRRSPMILINRDAAANALRQMVDQSRAAVAAGRSVLIFPEGTRKRVGAPIEFKRGVELLYKLLDVPSIPMVVNSGSFWGIGGGPLRPGVITVAFAAPVDPKLNSRDFMKTTTALMESEKAIIDYHFDIK